MGGLLLLYPHYPKPVQAWPCAFWCVTMESTLPDPPRFPASWKRTGKQRHQPSISRKLCPRLCIICASFNLGSEKKAVKITGVLWNHWVGNELQEIHELPCFADCRMRVSVNHGPSSAVRHPATSQGPGCFFSLSIPILVFRYAVLGTRLGVYHPATSKQNILRRRLILLDRNRLAPLPTLLVLSESWQYQNWLDPPSWMHK